MPTCRVATLVALSVAALAAPTTASAHGWPQHSDGSPVPSYDTTAPGAIEVQRSDVALAPGLELTTFDTYDANGFVRVHVLAADLRAGGVHPDLVAAGGVSDPKPLSAQADQQGAVAAVNGDFFNINETNSTLGPEIQGGVLRKGVATPSSVAAVGTDGIARLANVYLEGSVAVGESTLTVGALNSQTQPANGLAVFTSTWGHGDRRFISAGAPVTEVVVQDGVVTEVRDHATADVPGDKGMILVGQGTAAATLAAAKLGDSAKLSYNVKSDATADLQMAVGTRTTLVAGGTVATIPHTTDNDAFKPRTAIGWKDGGRTLLLTSVDGGASFSRGVGIQELADLQGRLGATDAQLLDGGGSTTMVGRLPGDDGVSLLTRPSDGSERAVPNGVGLFPAKGSGRLTGIDVRTSSARVFPGLTRVFTAAGYDETRAPVTAHPRWSASGGIGWVDDDGLLRARRSGTGTVTARDWRASGSETVQVLGALGDLSFGTTRVSLTAGGKDSVELTGTDAEGFDAPIAPRDAKLSFDESIISVTPQADGSLEIAGRADADGKATTITATVAGVTATVPVTVGLRSIPLADFESGAPWTSTAARAKASVAVVGADDAPGHAAGNHALQLTYDYTNQPAGTSAAYAVSQPAPITLPSGAQKLSVWVKGDGAKHWLRATLRSQGTTNVPFTFAATVDWSGWRRVEGDLPTGFSEPITLTNMYYVETSTQNRNAGSLVFDDLEAEVAQTVDTPEKAPESDPYVIQQGGLPGRHWRFALLSDLHTSAAAGANSFSGRQAIAALQQVAAARPDFVLVAGDAVDTNNAADFTFFEGLLKSYLPAGLPVYWVPGNHESGAVATGTLDTFKQVTGRPTQSAFDHKGTRFVLLNSTLGSLRRSQWDNLTLLRDQLDAAARDRSVRDVVVVFHHPLHDPTGTGASQLSDPLEAELVQEWLSDFRKDTGKDVAFFAGHAHDANVQREDGLIEVTTPPVGKTPYGSADEGGFFGWQMVGVDPRPSRLDTDEPNPESLDWIQGEVRPLIDAIALDAPAALATRESAGVSAQGKTSEFGLTFPLRYPATVTWSGSRGLAVVEGQLQARIAALLPSTIAVLDLDTMKITGIRRGTTTLTVASGTQKASQTITVSGR